MKRTRDFVSSQFKDKEELKTTYTRNLPYHVVKNLKSYQKEEQGVVLECETDTKKTVTIRLEFCGPRMLHYIMLPLGIRPKKSYIPLKKKWPPVDIKIRESKDYLSVQTGHLALKIEKAPFAVSCYSKDGSLIAKEEPLDTTVIGSYNVEPIGFWTLGDSVVAVAETLTLAPDEHFYGFGEKFTPFDKKGQEIIIWNENAFGAITEKAYKNVPFFISTKGYGIFVNSSCKIIYRMGSRSNASYSFEVMDGILDYYLIYGPSFKDILYEYTKLTGRTPVPPKWSFGLWMSVNGWDRTSKSYEKLCEQLKHYDIPCDVIHIDSWMKNKDFEWDKDAFPNPQEMIRKIKTKGFRVSLWENPFVPIGTKFFQEGAQNEYFLKKRIENRFDCVYLIDPWAGPNPMAIVDFTNPNAAKWFKEKHKPVFEMGVDVMKTDFGESIPEDAIFYNGETGARMHNLYSLLYNKTVFEATEEYTGRRGLVWSRSGYVGSQKYPTHWAGDPACSFSSMASVIRAGLSLSLSGFAFWSHDIGGYGTFQQREPTPELYIRWAQFGLFSPHSRCHGITRRDPWYFGDKALKIFRFYVKLRYRLLPYIYSYAFIASERGLPLMRPLVLEYQDDPNSYDKDLEYCFGREFLVAPIYDETGKRPIYLPKGRWIDYWSKKEHVGPTTLHFEASLHVLPLFVKGDSIIPMMPDTSHISEKPFEYITLDTYLYDQANFTLYDDNEVVHIQALKNNNEITMKIGKSSKTWTVKLNKTEIPVTVKVNGKEVEKCSSNKELDDLSQGWRWDSGKTTYVKITAKDKATLYLKIKLDKSKLL